VPPALGAAPLDERVLDPFRVLRWDSRVPMTCDAACNNTPLAIGARRGDPLHRSAACYGAARKTSPAPSGCGYWPA